MSSQALTTALAPNPLRSWIARLGKGNRWMWKVVFLIFALNIFMVPPRADFLWSRIAEEIGDIKGTNPKKADDCWDPLDVKITNPLADTSKLYPSDENWAKRTFRITPPLLAYVLHLGKPGYFIIQILAGLLQIRLLLGWFHRLTGGRLTATLLTMAISFTYYGQAAFFDSIGWGDPVGYCLLTCAITTRSPWVCALCVIFAGFTDERALAPGGFAILSHLLPQTWALTYSQPSGWRSSLVAIFQNRFTWAVIGGWVAYFVVRLTLGWAINYTQPYGLIGPAIIWRFETLHHFHASIFLTLKLMALPLCWLFLRRPARWTVEIGFAAAGAAVTLILGFAVLDHVRSLAYLSPACLFATHYFLETKRFCRKQLRPILIVLAAGNLVLPTTLWILDINEMSEEHRLQLQRPLPVEIIWGIERILGR